MSTEPYVPGEDELEMRYIRAKADVLEDPDVVELETEARRGIAKIKADAWAEGYETGCQSLYGTATPSGVPYDPEPNPYQIEEEA